MALLCAECGEEPSLTQCEEHGAHFNCACTREPEYVHFEGTAMVYSKDTLVYEKTQGWIQAAKLKPGDLVSRHTDPPGYLKVVAPPEEP